MGEAKKRCFSCQIDKPLAEMQQVGVWVCKECLEKSKPADKKPSKT